MKIIGYKWDGNEWVLKWFPRCKDGTFQHEPTGFHFGFYGPFGEVIGTCKICKMQFNASIREMDRQHDGDPHYREVRRKYIKTHGVRKNSFCVPIKNRKR